LPDSLHSGGLEAGPLKWLRQPAGSTARGGEGGVRRAPGGGEGARAGEGCGQGRALVHLRGRTAHICASGGCVRGGGQISREWVGVRQPSGWLTYGEPEWRA